MPISLQSGKNVIGDDSQLRESQLLRTFGRATFWLWFDRGALRLGTALAGLVLIRYLGPANYGVYTTAIAWGALLGAVLDLGLTVFAARVIGVDRQEGKRVVAVYVAVSVIALAAQLSLVAWALVSGHWYAACIGTGFIVVNMESTVVFCAYVLTAELQANKTLPGSVLSAAGIIAAVAAVIWLRVSVLGLLIALSIKGLAVASLRLWQIRDHWPSLHDFRLTQIRRTLANSRPFFSYTLAQMGYERTAVACLGFVALHEQVGLFGAAIAIASIYPQWSYAASDAVMPLLTRLFEQGRWDELIEFRQRLLDLLLFISVPVAVVLALFAPQICALLGPRFAGSSLVLRIIAYRAIVSVLDGFLGQAFLTAINRVRERRNAQIRSMIVLAVLTLVLGNYWGSVGAAIALLVADSSLLLQYLPICWKAKLGVRWPALWPSLSAGIGMAIAALYLPATWFAKVAPSLVVYFVVLALLARPRVMLAGRTLRDCVGVRS